MSDDQGRPCLADYLPDPEVRLFHVGRLDEQTEGLIILTNDGELAQKLAHPKYEINKTYLATVDGEMSRSTVRTLMSGIELEDGPIACDSVIVKQMGQDQCIVQVVLHSGRNRIVRRTLAAVGHPVRRLVRTHIGTLGIDGLKPGELRELDFKDLKALSVNSKW
jgi:23S rRNA pseudouridine2605 synthase